MEGQVIQLRNLSIGYTTKHGVKVVAEVYQLHLNNGLADLVHRMLFEEVEND